MSDIDNKTLDLKFIYASETLVKSIVSAVICFNAIQESNQMRLVEIYCIWI